MWFSAFARGAPRRKRSRRAVFLFHERHSVPMTMARRMKMRAGMAKRVYWSFGILVVWSLCSSASSLEVAERTKEARALPELMA